MAYIRKGHNPNSKGRPFLKGEVHSVKISKKGKDWRAYDLVGKRFGRLKVISRGIRPITAGNRNLYWDCICDCGNPALVPTSCLMNGGSKSCGCLQKEKARKTCINRRKIGSNNYINLYKPKHPNANKRGYVKEHIFIMSEFLNRPLMSGETVHHKNGIRTDNCIKNLELWTKNHGNGQRIEDLIVFAVDILKKYSPELLKEI